jgi:ribulose kinase
MEIFMKKYTIGVDFGTLSVRAVLLDAENGNEISASEFV